MNPVLPAMNTLWFWFEKATRRKLHGTPADVMRKFNILKAASCLEDGLEIFITPSRLKKSAPFDENFIHAFSKLKYKSIHIGDSDKNFLDTASAYDDLMYLYKVMVKLDTKNIVIHAHHFEKNRKQRYNLMLQTLMGCSIKIENNGFDNNWGGSIQGIQTILNDCPLFDFCLDIAHIKDFDSLYLDQFIKDSLIRSRIREIHYSFSTLKQATDPYEKMGFRGYGPFHALFSVLDLQPSLRTKHFILQFPIIMEGILPIEDRQLNFLKLESKQLH